MIVMRARRRLCDGNNDDEEKCNHIMYRQTSSSRQHVLSFVCISLAAVFLAFVTAHHVTNITLDVLYSSEQLIDASKELYEGNNASMLKGSHLRNANLALDLSSQQKKEMNRAPHSIQSRRPTTRGGQ